LFLPKAFLHPIITLFSIPTLYHISRNLKRFFTKNLTADFNFVSGLTGGIKIPPVSVVISIADNNSISIIRYSLIQYRL
ncbi:MAG: hypothetical protein SPH44_03530, partial [Eubacteriales bacterium]|nr:hypothetical protein [Eubacteriales bacterium]